MTETADRFRRAAAGLTRTIDAVPEGAWGDPSPCEGWDARDVVEHLVTWLPGPGFLLGTFEVDTGPIPSVDDDPAGAWAAVRDAIQAGLDDDAVAQRVEDCGPPGKLSFEAAVDMICTPDVVIHTWDLAQAAGIEVELDAELVAGVDAMPPEVDAAMRASGHYGRRVDVPADADALTRLLAFNGRRDDPPAAELGVFATRSPHRPNPIGLHEVTVVGVEGGSIVVDGLEAVDGTPVLDIRCVLGPLGARG